MCHGHGQGVVDFEKGNSAEAISLFRSYQFQEGEVDQTVAELAVRDVQVSRQDSQDLQCIDFVVFEQNLRQGLTGFLLFRECLVELLFRENLPCHQRLSQVHVLCD